MWIKTEGKILLNSDMITKIYKLNDSQSNIIWIMADITTKSNVALTYFKKTEDMSDELLDMLYARLIMDETVDLDLFKKSLLSD